MMTTTSTSVMGTPNLSIPATQNTAPILEHKCLFSHDLRRKQKRWQDGRLRFHTFNKRVMVYDLQGNFVGDLHWRHGEELQDGEELTLERGVMVQVEERIGKAEQDVSEVIAKRKTVNEPPPPSTNANPSTSLQSRSIAGASQLRPKSLNSVLGINRAPIGRAILPSRTPYEQRQQAGDPEIAERTLKRRRLDDETSDSASLLRHPPSPMEALAKTVKPVKTPRQVVDIDSDTTTKAHSPSRPSFDVPRPKVNSPLKARQNQPNTTCAEEGRGDKGKKKSLKQIRSNGSKASRLRGEPVEAEEINRLCSKKSKTSRTRQSGGPARNLESVSRRGKRTILKEKRTLKQHLSDESEDQSRREADQRKSPSPPLPSNILRFAPSRPVRKLMYKDLMPKSKNSSKQTEYQNLESMRRQTLAAKARIQARLNRRRQIDSSNNYANIDIPITDVDDPFIVADSMKIGDGPIRDPDDSIALPLQSADASLHRGQMSHLPPNNIRPAQNCTGLPNPGSVSQQQSPSTLSVSSKPNSPSRRPPDFNDSPLRDACLSSHPAIVQPNEPVAESTSLLMFPSPTQRTINLLDQQLMNINGQKASPRYADEIQSRNINTDISLTNNDRQPSPQPHNVWVHRPPPVVSPIPASPAPFNVHAAEKNDASAARQPPPQKPLEAVIATVNHPLPVPRQPQPRQLGRRPPPAAPESRPTTRSLHPNAQPPPAPRTNPPQPQPQPQPAPAPAPAARKQPPPPPTRTVIMRSISNVSSNASVASEDTAAGAEGGERKESSSSSSSSWAGMKPWSCEAWDLLGWWPDGYRFDNGGGGR